MRSSADRWFLFGKDRNCCGNLTLTKEIPFPFTSQVRSKEVSCENCRIVQVDFIVDESLEDGRNGEDKQDGNDDENETGLRNETLRLRQFVYNFCVHFVAYIACILIVTVTIVTGYFLNALKWKVWRNRTGWIKKVGQVILDVTRHFKIKHFLFYTQ